MWSFLAPLLAVAGGTYLATQANSKAANTAVAGINSAVTQQQSVDNSIAAAGGAGPGTSYLNSLVASPNTLTPDQQNQLKLMRASTINQLRGSGFAGSGKTADALFKSSEDNFTNGALQQNKQNAISAADRLQGTSTQAAEQGAQAGATGAEAAANVEANAGIATGKLYGQALGDIGSYLTRQNKLNTMT